MTAVANPFGDEPEFPAFRRPGPELAPIVERVLRMPEHRHLVEGDAVIHWLMRTDPKMKQGRRVLGTCYKPRVNGELSGLFDFLLERFFGGMPDFLVILSADYWEEATPLQREILVFHELMHAAQAEDENGDPKFHRETGLPIWTIKGHDIEEFNAVVGRYGKHSEDVEAFVAAAELGEAARGLVRVR